MKYLIPLLFLLAACDEKIEVRNQPPELTVTGFCTAGDPERVFFTLEVKDLESDPVNVDLLDGDGKVLGAGSAGDGDRGLSSAKQGTTHLIEWGQACEDEGCVDPCADRSTGPSGVAVCRAAPAELPASLTGTLVAHDGTTRVETSFNLTRTECP